VDVGIEDDVQGDGADVGEDPEPGVRGRRQDAPGGVLRGLDLVRPVAPRTPDPVADLDVGDVVGDLDDLADLFVSPPVEGVLDRRSAVDEEPPLRVPLLGQVGVAATVCGQFCSSGDPRVQRPDPDLAGGELLIRLGYDLDLAGRGETYGGSHGLSFWQLWNETVERDRWTGTRPERRALPDLSW
jgi:hypothetical protein